MWPRKEGFYIYLPDDGTGSLDEPSNRFAEIKNRLQSVGLDASWAYKYNGGSNPIGFFVPRDKISDQVLKQVLIESYNLA